MCRVCRMCFVSRLYVVCVVCVQSSLVCVCVWVVCRREAEQPMSALLLAPCNLSSHSHTFFLFLCFFSVSLYHTHTHTHTLTLSPSLVFKLLSFFRYLYLQFTLFFSWS